MKEAQDEIERLRSTLSNNAKSAVANDKSGEVEKLKKALSEANRKIVESSKEVHRTYLFIVTPTYSHTHTCICVYLLQVHDAHEELEKQLKESSKVRTRADALELQNKSVTDELKEARQTISNLKDELSKLRDQFNAATDALTIEKESNAKKTAQAESAYAVVAADLKNRQVMQRII